MASFLSVFLEQAHGPLLVNTKSQLQENDIESFYHLSQDKDASFPCETWNFFCF